MENVPLGLDPNEFSDHSVLRFVSENYMLWVYLKNAELVRNYLRFLFLSVKLLLDLCKRFSIHKLVVLYDISDQFVTRLNESLNNLLQVDVDFIA